MARGRKATPTHLKLLNGNAGKRPINENEPMPIGDLKAAPDWFDEDQRQAWEYAIFHSPKGLLRNIDQSLLTVWVIAECIHKEATKALGKGLIVDSPNTGTPMQNPYLPIINKQASIMMKAASELGFTPSSRSRISVDAPQNNTNRFANNGRRKA